MSFSHFPSVVKNTVKNPLKPHKTTPAGVSAAIPAPPPPDTHNKPLTLLNKASALALFALVFTFIPAHHASGPSQPRADFRQTRPSPTKPSRAANPSDPLPCRRPPVATCRSFTGQSNLHSSLLQAYPLMKIRAYFRAHRAVLQPAPPLRSTSPKMPMSTSLFYVST